MVKLKLKKHEKISLFGIKDNVLLLQFNTGNTLIEEIGGVKMELDEYVDFIVYPN